MPRFTTNKALAAFGELPICTVFHWITWCGWTEPAEWMAGAGVLADNSRFPIYCPPTNPVNHVGFGFGTAYPFFHYHDWRKDNGRIRFLGVPVMAYEVGYERGEVDLTQLKRAVDLGAFWHLPVNLFYHPVYLVKYPECVAGLKQGLEYMQSRGLRVLHYGPDRVTKWWLARSEAKLEQAERTRMRVTCDWEAGCIVQMLWNAPQARAEVDGQEAPVTVREEHGTRWVYVTVPQGTRELAISVPG